MKVKSIYIVTVVLIILSIFSYLNFVSLFRVAEFNMQDSLLQQGTPTNKFPNKIVILAIDDQSLEKLGKWPWKRTYIADVINKLSKGNPAAIGVDIIYSEKSYDPDEDMAMVEAVSKAKNIVIPVYGDFKNKYMKAGGMSPFSLSEPYSELKEVATTGHINAIPDLDDGVVRNNLVSFEFNGKEVKSFSWEIFNKYMQHNGKSTEGISIPKDAFNRAPIAFWGKPGDFEHISFYKVYNGEVPPRYFKDKIVLIGPYTVGLSDFYFSPLNHRSPMYGVEIHANIIQNYISGRFKQPVSDGINLLALIAYGLAAYFISRKLTPAVSAISVAGIIAVHIIVSKQLYAKGYILSLFYPILTVIVVFLIMLAYRYIEEYLERKRVRDVFGKYVAPQVVSQILEGGEEGLKLGGTRKEISALFVDIRGFTPLSEKVQPEEVVGILNSYLDLCAQSIFDYGGTLDKFIGDATMAIFNAPLDLEDHAFKAVQTAWAIKNGSQALEKELEEKFGRSVKFGIGVNTGFAVVGNIGAKFRMDYTAIGDTVNTAARLESNAKPGQILISQATYDLVKDRVEVESLGEIKVKGKEQGVPVFELKGIK